MNNRLRDELDRLYPVEHHLKANTFWEVHEPVECFHHFRPFEEEPEKPAEDWLPSLNEAIVKVMDAMKERLKKTSRLNSLEARILDLEAKLTETMTRETLVVPITTFEPEPFEVLKEIKAVVQKEDDEEFSATLFDANVNAAGCNQVEAIENLKDILLSRFEFLNAQPPEKLGPALAKQITVLREFIRRKE